MALPHAASAFAPACVGNLGTGFDILGHTIYGPGDTATVRRAAHGAVRITAITGTHAQQVPVEAGRNTAGRALLSLQAALELPFGFDIELEKGIALGSGMAGSAASCVAALVAANALLDAPLAQEALYPFALDGESLASGSRNGDNVGPMLTGGLALATPERLLRLAAPDWLHVAVVRPHVVVETLAARRVLQAPFPLDTVITQGAHLAQLLLGLQRGDRDLLRQGLLDVVVEPRRAALVPGFSAARQAALAAGALGASFSGAGPATFAWCDGAAAANTAALAMAHAYRDAGHECDSFTSVVNGPAAVLLAPATEP